MSEYEEYVCRFYPDNWGEKSITLFGVPIVRRRDCRHYAGKEGLCMRMFNAMAVEPHGFCAWGMRRRAD